MAAIENPFASPPFKARDEARLAPRLTLRRMQVLVGIGMGSGATLGALTSAVNGTICPQYFCDVMNWSIDAVGLYAVGEGILEGFVYGLIDAITFIGLISILSNRRCRFPTAVKYAFARVGLAFALWLCGGALAVLLVANFPQLQETGYLGYDSTWPAVGCYAWVRCSIWGIVYGGMVAVLLMNAVYAIRHRHLDLYADEMLTCPD